MKLLFTQKKEEERDMVTFCIFYYGVCFWFLTFEKILKEKKWENSLIIVGLTVEAGEKVSLHER